MSGYLAFMGKEFKEQIRTFKALILFIVLLLFGLVSPALAKIMPELLKLIPMDGLELTINIPAPTWMDAYAQFFKNITQIGIIVLLILLNGSISQEMQRGTLINMLSKGLARPTVILAKFTASGLLWSFCYVLSAVGTWIYTLILFGKHAPSHLFFSFFCLWLLGIFIIALLLFCSTLIGGGYGGILLTAGILGFLLLIGIFPQAAPYNPIALGSGNISLLSGIGVDEMISACVVTLLLTVLCIVGAIVNFSKKQL